MRIKELPLDYAMVLQQIKEDGGDTMNDLTESVHIDAQRMRHVIASLHHKGLIIVEQAKYGAWLTLSSKGRRYIRQLWPESTIRYGY